MKIVPVSEIPAIHQIQDVPTENLMDIYKVCLSLRHLCDKEHGVGISAVQTGLPWKLFVIKFTDSYGYFINCEYTPLDEEKILHLEGCLSLKTKKGQLRTFEVERYSSILVNGYQLKDNQKLVLEKLNNYSVSGFYSAVFQHEIQHHLGILISDIGKEMKILG